MVIYTRADVRKVFGISDYKLNKLIADGILSPPIRKKNQHPFWVAKHIRIAEEKLEELANPPIDITAKRTIRPFSEKLKAQILAAYKRS